MREVNLARSGAQRELPPAIFGLNAFTHAAASLGGIVYGRFMHTNATSMFFSAFISGVHSVSQMQIWVNGHEVFHVAGGSINANVTLPKGTNERFVVQAIDSTKTVAKVVETITVK